MHTKTDTAQNDAEMMMITVFDEIDNSALY